MYRDVGGFGFVEGTFYGQDMSFYKSVGLRVMRHFLWSRHVIL